MSVVAASDWVIDIGPGAGDEGGQIVAAGISGRSGFGAGQPHGQVSG